MKPASVCTIAIDGANNVGAALRSSVNGHPIRSDRGKKKADGEGFEPTVGRPYSGFQDRCIKPLCHPSGLFVWQYH